jgi:FkbM family methyltransferase
MHLVSTDLQDRVVGGVRRELNRLRRDPAVEVEALMRRLQWRIARRLTPVMAVDADGMRLFVSTADQTLSKGLFCYPGLRQGDAELAFAVLRSLPTVAERLAGCTVLEIGANIGSHTVEFLLHYGASHVVAIEPDPANFALLRQNVAVNDLADRTTLLQLAASETDGQVELELSPDNAGDHRVRVPGGGESTRTSLSVPAASVDSLQRAGRIDLDAVGLAWIDVQGHEAHVLRGAHRLLESGVPIVMEYWPGGLRRSGDLESLHELIAARYPYLIDLNSRGEEQPCVISSSDLPALEAIRNWGDGRLLEPSTDLVLAPDIAPKWRFSGLTPARRPAALG